MSIFLKKIMNHILRAVAKRRSFVNSGASFCLLALLISAALIPDVSIAGKQDLMVARTIVNLRQNPALNSQVVWILSPEKVFKVGELENGWYPVFPAAALSDAAPVGYVSRKVVEEAPADADVVDWGDIRYVGADVKFHTMRTDHSPVAGRLEKGDQIKVGFLRDGWYGIFPVDQDVVLESDALGYVRAGLVDLDLPDAKIRYAVRKTSVIEKPAASSKQVGYLYPGHRAQVGKEQGGMYALYRIDTKVKKDTPVWGYAWGPFLAPYPRALEKEKLSGMIKREKEKARKEAEKALEMEKRAEALAVMDQALEEASGKEIPTREMYSYAVLNVRSEPNVDSLIVAKLEKGEKILAGPAKGKWFPVFEPGKPAQSYKEAIGYVYGAYIKAEAPKVEKKEKTRKKRAASGPDQVPIKITSTKMTFSENENQVTFSGDVKVVRLDVTLTSDFLTAYLRAGGDSLKDTENKIKKIVAKGNVDVVMKNRKGKCDKLTFMVDDSIILLEGNARLEDGKNVVQGNIIKFYLKDSRSEVIGGGKPVEAIFYTPKDVSP